MAAYFEDTIMGKESGSTPSGEPNVSALTLGASVSPEERKARLELADRLTTLGTLSAAIGHELNNPLTYVIGNLNHVIEQLDHGPKEQQEDVLEAIREALGGAERIARIVQDMRSLGRQGPVKLEPVDLETAVELAVRQTSNHIRHRARLTRRFSAAPLVDADVPRICQVFVNLLLNAAQAIPPGEARRHEICVSLREDGDEAIVEISDTGAGISENALQRVFEPFFTTKAVGEGTGLGLAISRSIVESLGGRIELESTFGLGTTVRVRLHKSRSDAVQPVAELPTVVTKSDATRKRRRARLLLVDDDPGVLTVTRRVLERSYDVDAVPDARAALAILQQGPRIDLILCDLMMPEMNGMDLHREIAKRSQSLADRMLFMTGGAFTPEARGFLEGSHRPHVQKPFVPSSLLGAVEAQLAKLPEEPESLPPTTVADHGDKPTGLHLRFPKEWDQLEVVRESCGFFARAAYRDVLVGQRVALVVHELVENAIKYASPDEDRVEVDVQGGPQEFEVAVWNKSSDEHVGTLLGVLEELEKSDPAEVYATAMRRVAGQDAQASSRLGLARIVHEARVRLAADFRRGAMCLVARGAP
jgi:signal transduction histidine kinase